MIETIQPLPGEMRGILEEIRSQLASLSERVRRVEGVPEHLVNAAPAKLASAVEKKPASPPPVAARPVLSEEELLALSAAIAAFLGVRVRIRQIRLVGSSVWAQEGRVSVQASHRLHS